MENCEIYFTKMHYKGQNWLDDPDRLLDLIFNNLNEINGFHFSSISLNMAQVYNVSLKNTNYDSMIMFLKGVKYAGKQFYDLTIASTVDKLIRKQLSYIEDLYFENMEIRSSSSYSDIELGLYIPIRRIVKPSIVEQQKN